MMASSKKKFADSVCVKFIKNNFQTVLLLLGVFLGISLGIIIKFSYGGREWTVREVSYVSFPGDLFLNMLKGLTVPLIISSLITAVGSLDIRLMGKIGGKAALYYLSTTIIAVMIAILLSITIEPGRRTGKENLSNSTDKFDQTLTQDAIMDIFRNLFPQNIVQAAVETYQTKLERPEGVQEDSYLPLEKYELNGQFVRGVNVMGLMAFSIFMGVALAILGERGKPVFKFMKSFSEAMLLITGWIIWMSPVGILFLLVAEVLKIDDFQEVLIPLGLYLITVLTGYLIHAVIILPGIYIIFIRKLPFKFIGNMVPALITAAGTSSTLATLPVTLRCLEGPNNIDSRITRFLMPVAATMNMDAMALYEAAAVLFIAQLHGVDMGIGRIIAVSFTATVASIGASSIPQSGLVMMVMVLGTVGLPVEYISFILPVDFILDRLMTSVNLLGDSIGAAIICHVSKNDLSSLETPDSENTNGYGKVDIETPKEITTIIPTDSHSEFVMT